MIAEFEDCLMLVNFGLGQIFLAHSQVRCSKTNDKIMKMSHLRKCEVSYKKLASLTY